MTRVSPTDARRAISADWLANRRAYKTRIILLSLRVTQLFMGDTANPRRISYPFVAFHRFLSEWVFSMEIRPTTTIGPGLAIHHGFGIVVNPQAVVGANVTLRNGVVIGNKVAGGPCPIIEDGVEFGANAVVIGGIRMGQGAVVGAGAVVVRDVAPNAIVAGNPPHMLRTQHAS